MFQRPYLRRVLQSLAVAASFAAPMWASAETLYSQPFAETESGGYFSSSLSGYLQFDSFVLSADSTVQSVSWFGVDLNELIPITPLNPTAFTVSIYSDNGGAVGSLLSTSTIGDSAGATAAGSLLGLVLYRYTGTLTTAFQATAGTTYWLGITDPTTDADWFWASGSGPDGTHIGIIGGAPSVYVDDMSFTIDGTVTAVPEPASAALMLLGVAGLVAARSRKR